MRRRRQSDRQHRRSGGHPEDTHPPEGTSPNSCGCPVAQKPGTATSQPVRLTSRKPINQLEYQVAALGNSADVFRPKVGYWLESGGLRERISGGVPEFSKIFGAIRAKKRRAAVQQPWTLEKRDFVLPISGFYSSYTSLLMVDSVC